MTARRPEGRACVNKGDGSRTASAIIAGPKSEDMIAAPERDRCEEEPVREIAAHAELALSVANQIASSPYSSSRAFSMIGTSAFSARSRSDTLGWLVIRIAGAVKSRVAQLRDQVQSTHRGHFLIDHETVAAIKVACAQQFCSARVAADGQAFNLQPEFERISDGEIIVNDGDNQTRLRQFAFSLVPAAPDSRVVPQKAPK